MPVTIRPGDEAPGLGQLPFSNRHCVLDIMDIMESEGIPSPSSLNNYWSDTDAFNLKQCFGCFIGKRSCEIEGKVNAPDAGRRDCIERSLVVRSNVMSDSGMFSMSWTGY
ncbi:hypothetical protein C0J52_06802 [Blattella germanica]|nr:hypothetical protein C0J52_06802 [Blattella germanica]